LYTQILLLIIIQTHIAANIIALFN